MLNKIKIIVLIFFFTQLPVFAQTQDSFNLSMILENIINYQSKSDFSLDEDNNAKENFIYAVQNLYNGNVVVAYNEFLKTIDLLDKNVALLMLSQKLYKCGFFSLGDIAISKITGKNKMAEQIADLKKTYKPFYNHTKDEESYLVKAYTSIYYNNSPEEAAFNLIKKTALMENSDYANYIMALAMYECRQYAQAVIYADKAIQKNEDNSNYKYFKLKALHAQKKDKEALKYLEENKNNFSVFLVNDIMLLKQDILSSLSSDESDKKFYQIYSYYLAGDYYKTLQETQNFLNFNKNNYKIITLQGMAHLALGEAELASYDFQSSFKINKNFELTKMGIADINFINKNYKDAYEGYKKLFNSELKNEAVLKAYISLENINPSDKKLEKINKIKSEFENKSFFEYYLIANNLFNDDKEKQKYIIKSLGINMLNQNSFDVVFDMEYKQNNFDGIDKILFLLVFSDNLNAKYYYYSALSLNNKNLKREAFYELKKAIALDDDFKPASELINKLQNELI